MPCEALRGGSDEMLQLNATKGQPCMAYGMRKHNIHLISYISYKMVNWILPLHNCKHIIRFYDAVQASHCSAT